MKKIIFVTLSALCASLFASADVVPISKLYTKEYFKCVESVISEYDATKCLEKEIKKQDKLLNEVYKSAMKNIQPFRKKDLKNIHRLWIKYIDAKCSFLYHKESGTSGLSNASECKLNETIKRTIELEEIL